jgi:hypothetical protein
LLVGFFDRRFEPHLHEMQHATIADATSHRLHQFGVGDRVEVPAQVRVDHLGIPASQPGVDRLDGVQRTAAFTIRVLLRLQIGLENRAENDHGGHLHHAIADRGNTHRSLLAVRLGNPYPPHGWRSIRLVSQCFRQFPQPAIHAVAFDVRERLAVHARCSAVRTAAAVGVLQHIFAVQFVVQQVEPIAGFSLRFATERRLKFPNLFWRCKTHHQSPGCHFFLRSS